ncbi:Pentatricopeptide repeat-containing protein [Hordeum vulgare]|nr:Pentatricopeptide repeat-containing protein [Hordeum vulgare]
MPASCMAKGKEVMPPLERGKEVVPPYFDVHVQDRPSPKQRKYGHYHEEAGHLFSETGGSSFASGIREALSTVCIWYMVTFKMLTPNTMKVIILNDNVVEVVTKCKKHDEAFA